MSSSKIRVAPVALTPPGGDYDYTGYNSLGCLVAYAKVHHGGTLREAFDFGSITPTAAAEALDLYRGLKDEPGIVLLSTYVWNSAVNMAFARDLKLRSPNVLVVVGGPQVPRMPGPSRDFFGQHPFVDIAVRHEGEITLAEILSAVEKSGVGATDLSRVDFSNVTGLTFHRNGDLIRTPDRERTKDLSVLPSPYTTGEFDHWFVGKPTIPLETNRGCPYGCTFCDWGAATLAKLYQMTMERVQAEIDFAARRQVEFLFFCDANFGIFRRDVEIARYIIAAAERHGYPKKVGFANAKTASPHLMEVIKIMFDAGLTQAAPISMQTTDQQVLDNVDRTNIKLSEYGKLIAFFNKEGIPTVSDMMLGLPGQTLETCKRDFQFFFDHKVLAVLMATSVMPNAPMADEEYKRRFKITVSDEGLVESTYSFTREEYNQMLELSLAYKLFVKLGVLKYFLYFVQIEYGVKAIDFLATWVETSLARPDLYPISHRIRRDMLVCVVAGGGDWLELRWSEEVGRFLFDELDDFHGEILDFFEREHGLRLEGSAVEAVLAANREVMPRKGREFPATVPLQHDVPAYFAELRKGPKLDDLGPDHLPLGARGPGERLLPTQSTCMSYEFRDVTLRFNQWEVLSNLGIQERDRTTV